MSSYGTKIATKGRDYNLSLVRTKFKILFDRVFNTRPKIILREDFYLNNRHEITPKKGSSLVLL